MSGSLKKEIEAKIKIDRPLYENDQLRQDFMYEKPKATYLSTLKTKELKYKKIILGTIPILGWISQYSLRHDLFPDIVAGITLGIMNIPQGMAYGLLAKVDAVTGIYTSFFPVIIYIILGTSRHNSMGTFAVISLMIRKVVLEHSDSAYFQDGTGSVNATDDVIIATGYSPLQVVTALSFVVAIMQIAMFVLRLGAVSVLLSDTLVSGFTTGAAIQVLVSQFKDLLGIKLPGLKGYFVLVKSVQCLIERITETNHVTLTITAIVITCLIVDSKLVKPFIAKRSPVPIPTELIIIICATVLSKYLDLEGQYGVKIVGDIPTGFPDPSFPLIDLMAKLILDALPIAIVSYSISLSMAMIFAQKYNYEVDANQELLAMGAGNLFGSFFSSMPMAASLTRSSLVVVVGGKTQVVSIICCILLLFVMLWLGPAFQLVPKCVLASVIVVALKRLLGQVTAVFTFWKFSKMDAAVWIITLLTVVFVAIDIGLLVGVALSLLTIFYFSFKPYTCLLGTIPNTDLYLDCTRYKGCREINGLKIFQYCGGINFATRTIFKSDLFGLIGMNPETQAIYRKNLHNAENMDEVNKETVKRWQNKINYTLKCLIMDFSTVNLVDPSGIAMLKSVIESFEKVDVPVYIAGCTDPVYNLMEKCGLFSTKSSFLRLFPSTHDAVKCYGNIFNVSTEQPESKIRRRSVINL